MNGYSRSIVRHGWVWLLACVAAAAWAGWLLPGFSVDAGLGFTDCDTNGAGSNAGQDFDGGKLGAIEVTEP